jgi:light-regulated signal transduction histidine kinase (bacteriophytochrome)
MHATLTELLENLSTGMLWLSGEGQVRYANARAVSRTRLTVGQAVNHAALAQAVKAAVLLRKASWVTMAGIPAVAGGAAPELKCKVLPGLSSDDAVVLISDVAEEQASVGFDNLMMVIRSDLKEPLQDLTDALAVARNQGDVHALDALCDRVDETREILSHLVELGQVWNSESLLANDRIELWALLQQAWTQVEPVARQRGVKIRFNSQIPAADLATLYGSEPWLRRVMVECLLSAVRGARGGSLLDIEHRQMGPRAMIVLRDSGAFATASQSAESEVLGGQTKKTPPTAVEPRLTARDMIGLKLCQQIVALHGGQLREEKDDELRNFLIDLPTGAPHRANNPELDIAQAQRYASDLAELMAKRRKAANNAPKASAA